MQVVDCSSPNGADPSIKYDSVCDDTSMRLHRLSVMSMWQRTICNGALLACQSVSTQQGQ